MRQTKILSSFFRAIGKITRLKQLSVLTALIRKRSILLCRKKALVKTGNRFKRLNVFCIMAADRICKTCEKNAFFAVIIAGGGKDEAAGIRSRSGFFFVRKTALNEFKRVNKKFVKRIR